jgi:hypothetical protein
MIDLHLDLLAGTYSVCKLSDMVDAPKPANGEELFNLTITDQEISLVCRSNLVENAVRSKSGWRAFQVRGPLDFSEVGILARLTNALAGADVPVFALSTYDTDYLLVQQMDLVNAQEALRKVAQIHTSSFK